MSGLREYITEAISSGNNNRRLKSNQIPKDQSFDSITKWLLDLGVERITDKEMNKITGNHIEKRPMFWASKSMRTGLPVIFVWIGFINEDGKNDKHTFVINYPGEKDHISDITVTDKDGFTELYRSSVSDKLEFIQNCVLNFLY